MFVLTISGGEYDDKWERVECVSEKKELLEERVEKLKEERAKMAAFFRKKEALLVDIHKRDDYPRFDLSKLRDIKKWPSGLRGIDITDEMRAERDADNSFNQTQYKRFKNVQEEWNQKVEIPAFIELYAKEGITVPIHTYELTDTRYYQYESEVYYDISEVEVI